jgi:hypothetical protein
MDSRNKKPFSLGNIYQLTFHSLKSQPKIFIPFLIFAAIESVFLFFIYVAPRVPFRTVLGPPIRAFWGEGFLHYPANFLLLPKLASMSRTFLSVILGSLTSGLAVSMIFEIYNKKTIKFPSIINSTIKKYISLFGVVLCITIIFYVLVRLAFICLTKYFMAGHAALLSLKPGIWLGPILVCINLLIGIFVQAVFIYVIPLLIVEQEKLFKAIVKSFALFTKLFIPTLVLIILPILFYIPIIVLQYHGPYLINKVFPEAILIVSFLSIIMSSLVIDFLITVSTTFLYLNNRDKSGH